MIRRRPFRAGRPGAIRGRGARWLAIGAVGLCLALVGCGVPESGAGFSTPPRRAPVQTVLVSASGRTLTAVGTQECGHDPRLVAKSHPHSVSLIFAYPPMGCHAEAIRLVTVRTSLPQPLGGRALVDPGGGRIPSFSQRQFARVTVLPAGYRLASEIPAGQPAGDRRTYTVPPGAAGASQPCPCAHLVIWQQVIGAGFLPPTPPTSQRPGHAVIHGIRAAVLTSGPFFLRSVNWAEHGYYLTVGVAYDAPTAGLTTAQLIAVANGLRMGPRPGTGLGTISGLASPCVGVALSGHASVTVYARRDGRIIASQRVVLTRSPGDPYWFTLVPGTYTISAPKSRLPARTVQVRAGHAATVNFLPSCK
ncbi:MAG: hypothetical protein ACYCU3_11780 [Streptosporangiaceae bacterium]